MLRKSSTLLLFFFIVAYQSFSQSATGSWYGKADVLVQGNNSNYLTELVLKQKGNTVEGIFGYYFKDSYQSFFVRGTYNSKSREIHIKNLPVIFYGSSTRNGIECPMHFLGLLMVSKVNSTLRGSFYTDDKYKYTCPELRVSYKMDESESNQDSILRNTIAGKKFWQPQEEDFIVTTPRNNTPKTVSADVTTTSVNTGNIKRSFNDDMERALIANFEKRKNTYGKDLLIESDSIRVSFYDNGDIDGDTISVFLNSKPVLAKQEITARAMNVYLALDSTKDINEVSMFADNLGKYPPNTALMIVTDGINRYEIYLSSNLTQNATVRLRKKK